MTSMKRIVQPFSIVVRAMSPTSWSFTPRMTTHVELDGRQAHGLGGRDALEHLVERRLTEMLPEGLGVERIERDVDPVEPGLLERSASRARARRWSKARGPRPRGRRAGRRPAGKLLAHEGLAAGEAELAHAAAPTMASATVRISS